MISPHVLPSDLTDSSSSSDVFDTLSLAQQHILQPAHLTETDLLRALGTLRGTAIDDGDLYFQAHRAESWLLEDSQVKNASRTQSLGFGARAVSGTKTGFAYSDEVTATALYEAAQAARRIAQGGGEALVRLTVQPLTRNLYTCDNPIDPFAAADKVRLLETVDRIARACDPRVIQVMVNLTATYDVILILTQEGRWVADSRPLVRLNVTVIVERNGQREQGSSGAGGRFSYSALVNQAPALAREAVRRAQVNLIAQPTPAGTLTVVLGPGWPGILLHEAIGHGLEGDFNRKGTSAFAGRVGERVATPHCTVVDDGTLPQRRGSLHIDDEGTETQCTVLIEKGILKGYLHDRLNARLMHTVSTGNGRRQSYAHLPLPRMTNTYLRAGTHDPDDIIASVTRGLYAVYFAGGQVDITSGQFVFSTNEAYWIEHGKITYPVKGATLIGNGPDVLTRVAMVGNDLQLDPGIGTCGKEGQTVPVGVGQPTLRIDALTVGGTQT